MAALLRCPACNEIIADNVAECRYCSLPLDQKTVREEVAKFSHVSDAVAQANTLQSFNFALVPVGVLCIYILFSGAAGLRMFYVFFLPYCMVAAVIYWFIRFGKLRSKDPEFEPARAAMKKSLLMWGVAIFIYSICILLALIAPLA